MSKPGVDPTSGISSGDVMIPTERHPACRRREARPGSGVNVRTWPAMPREKVQAALTARPKVPKRRRGADCLVVAEGSVMELERRGWVTAVDLGQPVRRDEPLVQRKAAAFARWHEPYKSRGLRTVL